MTIQSILFSSLLKGHPFIEEFFGRKNITILLSGYFEKFKAKCPTGSFKDYITGLTLHFRKSKELVVVSAGNVARAFFYKASVLKRPLTIVLPEYALENLKIPVKPSKSVTIYAVKGEYNDAIDFSKKLVKENPERYEHEGGLNNEWRIKGLYRLFRRLPEFDVYFQAVSGGVGPLSIYKTAKSLNRKLPKLYLSQNLPYAPVLSAIKGEPLPPPELAEKILAKVLSNARTNIELLSNLIKETSGKIYGITNEELLKAKSAFESFLEEEIDYSAGVTIASVLKAIENNELNPDEKILIHITGGGYEKVKKYPPSQEQIIYI
ncbi:pyridoxal-phosphate dependent enzyme [Desulfurobacterium atlanticum]|uniref:Cysteate synthase n=1 Tax=Desulfurobacterium atlanticum TaxID=240169 RepID=A0A239ACV3_9BACT|nr:pyridoxal-phosphate dependent enzyme [Desulfurobacterium atlanticum]SNR93389.1 cysteate synthase [Desulfurobacterium atlanticum]